MRGHAQEAPRQTLETADKSRLRVVFMGSDSFSLPSLETCLAQADVVAVYTQPDRRSGRGRKRLTRSPVAELARRFGLHLEQPEAFDKRCLERLRGFEADLIVVAAYGQILPAPALRAARMDSINVHASLLPRHRGAAPIAAAILAGDAEAGVTIMKLRPRLDAGEIICYGERRRRAQKATPIRDGETSGQLSARLAAIGGELLADILRAFADGSVTYEVQDETQATTAPMLQKSDGRIDWSRPADRVARHIRAMTPWPGAYSELHLPGREPIRVIVLRARTSDQDADQDAVGRPGRIGRVEGPRLVVSTGARCIELIEVKPAGRGPMNAADFLRGSSAVRQGPEPDGGPWFADA